MKYFKRLILSIILSALLLCCTDFLNPAFLISILVLEAISKSDLGSVSNISQLFANAEISIVVIILATTILFSTIILMLIQRILILCINSYKIENRDI